MAEETKNPYANQVTQIQIQVVDNGFLIQAVNIDGKNKTVRKVAHTIEELRSCIGEVAAVLYEPPTEPETPSGPTGQESPAGEKATASN